MKKSFIAWDNIKLFEGLSSKEIETIMPCLNAKEKFFEKGETILHDGEENLKMGIFLSGKGQITRSDYEGNRVVLSNIVQGDIFGEAFAYAGIKKIPVSVIAIEASNILFIDYKKVFVNCSNMCEFHSKLTINMAKILANKNIMMQQKIRIISKKTTRQKILAFLHMESIRLEKRNFEIPFDRQELADYLCVDRSALSRELSKLREEGLINYKKNKFRLLY